MTALLRLVPLRWAAVGLAFGVLVGWHLLEKRRAYDAGWEAALATVERMDARARDAARDARSAVDACFDQGGTWDAITAHCRL